MTDKTLYHLYTDGASRNNPGPAGIGWVVTTAPKPSTPDQILTQGGEYIGEKTNNEAEYLALIRGLTAVQKLAGRQVTCYLDSLLVVNQLNGLFKVKRGHLAELVVKVKTEEAKFTKVTYHHIPREDNHRADKLANQAIDQAIG